MAADVRICTLETSNPSAAAAVITHPPLLSSGLSLKDLCDMLVLVSAVEVPRRGPAAQHLASDLVKRRHTAFSPAAASRPQRFSRTIRDASGFHNIFHARFPEQRSRTCCGGFSGGDPQFSGTPAQADGTTIVLSLHQIEMDSWNCCWLPTCQRSICSSVDHQLPQAIDRVI